MGWGRALERSRGLEEARAEQVLRSAEQVQPRGLAAGKREPGSNIGGCCGLERQGQGGGRGARFARPRGRPPPHPLERRRGPRRGRAGGREAGGAGGRGARGARAEAGQGVPTPTPTSASARRPGPIYVPSTHKTSDPPYPTPAPGGA